MTKMFHSKPLLVKGLQKSSDLGKNGFFATLYNRSITSQNTSFLFQIPLLAAPDAHRDTEYKAGLLQFDGYTLFVFVLDILSQLQHNLFELA